MEKFTINALRETLIRDGIVKPSEFTGCTSEEVNEAKLCQKINWLPSLYQEFLLFMGRSSGKFLGVDFSYPTILGNKEEAIDDLEFNQETFKLPDDSFVFGENQGYEFFFFRTNELVDDPPVFYYLEGTAKGQGTITKKGSTCPISLWRFYNGGSHGISYYQGRRTRVLSPAEGGPVTSALIRPSSAVISSTPSS